MSNTKLADVTFVGKQMVKKFISDFESQDNVLFNVDNTTGITMLAVTPFPGSNTAHIATSVCSPDEQKFRPTVGKFLAIKNYRDGKYIAVPFDTVEYILNALS